MTSQVLPTNREVREALRAKGQFWTPAWVAEAMVAYVTSSGARQIFDPAVGAGAFFVAAKNLEAKLGTTIGLSGTEVDASALEQALSNGLDHSDLGGVTLEDFTAFKPDAPLPAIVANPPYIRHHRLDRSTKNRLRALSHAITGFPLDGRAGYHVYFLIHALSLLAERGRLAFILPADTCEGVFSQRLWQWIARRYRLEAVVTFEPKASPFPRVDTNAVVVLIENSSPRPTLQWARVANPSAEDLKRWVWSDFQNGDRAAFSVRERSLVEALRTGLSRSPQQDDDNSPTLGDFAKVLRGIATGANEFFFLTAQQAADRKIPARYLLPAIGRTRDVETEIITPETLRVLNDKGRPTLLLSIDGRAPDELPLALRNYLARGEEAGLNKRALIKTRRPWYKMEVRAVPPILFAYLGRRNARFIRNEAGALPLTGFLCVYPRHQNADFVEQLWQVLQQPETVANLTKVGKSYGEGAIKVEPRALEKLPLPQGALERFQLPWPRRLSSSLFD